LGTRFLIWFCLYKWPQTVCENAIFESVSTLFSLRLCFGALTNRDKTNLLWTYPIFIWLHFWITNKNNKNIIRITFILIRINFYKKKLPYSISFFSCRIGTGRICKLNCFLKIPLNVPIKNVYDKINSSVLWNL